MLPLDLVRKGEHEMTVCNSCRYCEQYCPVFPAMERRLTFTEADLAYLANLCHNCGECLYACQYAPPHEFGIDVPRTLAKLRLETYEAYCWPAPLARAFRRQGAATALTLAAGFKALLFGATWWFNPQGLTPRTDAEFYAVIPHAAMVSLFGAVGVFVLIALAAGVRNFWRHVCGTSPVRVTAPALARALWDAATLRHLHGSGTDCVIGEEARTPWRRWFHHFTFGGFMLCVASTSVAALYHTVFGWEAPYPYTSLPVVLGTVGGVGLTIGPVGQWVLKQRRDAALGDPDQEPLDIALLLLLWLTSVTGLALLVLRTTGLMAPMLIAHLGIVLALFVTIPYGKFVHGLYRTAALVKNAAEETL